MSAHPELATMQPVIGIYGGTFDPIHYAHIFPVQQAAQQVGIEQVKLMPCHIPPHKNQPNTKPSDRLAMVKLVSEHVTIFSADDRELRRHKASYTIDTLEEMRSENPNSPICFFIGMDSLTSFHQWHRWQDILDYCHLVVCCRPGYHQEQQTDIADFLQQRETAKPQDLHDKLNGHVFYAQTDEIDISSTMIRENLRVGLPVDELLPPYILSYIRQHHLYLAG
ncbi:nicotinate-nucleotide adenylyltransferase [Paraneptunicella aestuarii]|uniref:nicotinate-nucleotide adenylyltransferase n=1 Tax=Paraneptunicella aestuarii TaxID=2831148 RepID=UPI001E2B02F2|nr:nicotinate-nucleotide adenylyltransferase [Paraneptunicella aestuarii]UAA39941.1 nicotinate-nucleotide adenylyltransferase [Paraneptunicella aestuarii]